MGGDEERGPLPGALGEQGDDEVDALGVEMPFGLVEQDDVGGADQGQREVEELQLTGGEL